LNNSEKNFAQTRGVHGSQYGNLFYIVIPYYMTVLCQDFIYVNLKTSYSAVFWEAD